MHHNEAHEPITNRTNCASSVHADWVRKRCAVETHDPRNDWRTVMTQYLYQAAYTAESLATQMKDPVDRLALVSATIEGSVDAKIIGGGFSFGDYDVTVIIEAADDTTMAAVAIALGAGGAIRSAKTTPLLSGDDWVVAMTQASSVSYTPAS